MPSTRRSSNKTYFDQQNSDPAEGADDLDYDPEENPVAQSDGSDAHPSTPVIPPQEPTTYTPQRSKRPREPRDTSDELRANVVEAAPDGDRDALTRAPNYKGINQLCHVLPHSMPEYQIVRLKRVLGTKFINVDSRFNLMHASPNEHAFYDKPCHGFSPERSLLRDMHFYMDDAMGDQCYTEIFPNGKVYNYIFLPLDRDDPINFFVSDEIDSSGRKQKPVYMEQPLAARGVIKSHINPFFMLWNLGNKIYQFENGPHPGIPSSNIWTGEQHRLYREVKLMTDGWFGPKTEQEIEKFGGLFDRKVEKMPGSSRSESATARAKSAAGDATTLVDGEGPEQVEQDMGCCLLEVPIPFEGKQVFQEGSGDEHTEGAVKRQKIVQE